MFKIVDFVYKAASCVKRAIESRFKSKHENASVSADSGTLTAAHMRRAMETITTTETYLPLNSGISSSLSFVNGSLNSISTGDMVFHAAVDDNFSPFASFVNSGNYKYTFNISLLKRIEIDDNCENVTIEFYNAAPHRNNRNYRIRAIKKLLKRIIGKSNVKEI